MLAVPVEQALAYTAERGWHVLQAPPAWWLEERELEHDRDEERARCAPALLAPEVVVDDVWLRRLDRLSADRDASLARLAQDLGLRDAV